MPFYHPGNIVQAKIMLSCVTPVHAKELKIRIIGKEQVSFNYSLNNDQGLGRNSTGLKRKLFEFESVCCKFDAPLSVGEYTIPFEFELPDSLPASIMFQKLNIVEAPVGIVKYSIQAKAVMVDGTELKQKQLLIV